MSDTHHWDIPTAVRRQARAADMWLELSGQRRAAAPAEKTAAVYTTQDLEARARAAQPGPLGQYLKRGLAVGGVIGAGIAGHSAHVAPPFMRAGVGAVRHSVPRAALGGGIVGGAAGGTLAGAFGLGRHVQHVVERPPAVPAEQPEDYLMGHDRLNPPEKKASAYDQLRQAVSGSPLARKAVGAAAVGIPMAAAGYALEKGRHTPGPNGVSPYQAATRGEQEQNDAAVDAGGHPLSGRLRKLYLDLKSDAADDAAKHPRLSGALGAAIYGGVGGLTGASLGSRILR